MRKPATMQEARAFVEELRRELLRQKRTVGDPRASCMVAGFLPAASPP